MRRSISLRTYFSMIFGILIIIMTGILSATIGDRASTAVKSEIGNSLQGTAYQMVDKMDSFMWSRSGEIYTLSELDALKNLEDTAEIQKLLDKLKESFPVFAWIGLTDENGIVIASTQGILSGADISQRPVFTEGIEGEFIGDVHDAVMLAKLLPNPTGEAMKFVDISIPIIDDAGLTKGVLAAHLSWEWASEVERSVLAPLHERSNIEMFVISSVDNIVLLGQKDMIGKQLTLESLEEAKLKKEHWSVEKWDDGKLYFTGFALENGYMDYEGLGWTVIVRQPLHDAYSGVRQLQFFIMIIGVVFAFLFSIAGWLLAGKISNPINKVSTAAEELRKGSQIQIPAYRGIKEVELLSVSLRELVASLTRSESALGEMKNAAHHDHLTSMPNRFGLERFLGTATKSASLRGSVLIFLCLDLDGFKAINDTYGHHAGDILLQEVAQRLTSIVRNEELVARLGGDEFAVILQASENKPVEDGYAVSNRIIKELNRPFLVDGHRVYIGCSVGGAIWEANDDTRQVLQLADEALYRSKNNGKNRATFHTKQGSGAAFS